jgi:CRP-like cAMP-binding protein
VALIGREGAVGGIVSNGSLPAYANAVVRVGGQFFRIKTAALEQAKLESIALRHWFARYSDCLIAQVFQTSACNATHTIMQRSAKWLLAAMERTRQSHVEITQEELAQMLGVGRTFVTRVVRQLRNEGIITTRRGAVVVLDRAALQAKSCRCTALIENHYDTVLHGIYPRA